MPIRPLDGITVLSLEHAIAAPFATRQLADQGARVIKIERPGSGDFARAYDQRVGGLSSHFVWTNRSKESLTLDLKHEACGEILPALLARADVLVQNLAPGAAARLGLSYQKLHPQYPQLIVCDISGYGEGGPLDERKAYDLLVQGEAGFLSLTGTPTHTAKAGIPIADIAAGMYAYSGIQNALLLRTRLGSDNKPPLGSHVQISMLEALAEWLGFPLYYTYQGNTPPARSGAEHATIYPYGPFLIGDGQTLMIGVQNEREWQSFCHTVLQEPTLAQEANYASVSLRSLHRETLRQRIEKTFASLDTPAVEARLNKADIAYSHVNSSAYLWEHPQLKARSRWQTINTEVGEVPALIPPAHNNQYSPRMSAVPALGEHTLSILQELGFSPQTISQWQALKAI